MYFFQVVDPECSGSALRRRMTRSGLYVHVHIYVLYMYYTSYTQFRSSNCNGLISAWMKCEFNLLLLLLSLNDNFAMKVFISSSIYFL
jgi:hypothetical protein